VKSKLFETLLIILVAAGAGGLGGFYAAKHAASAEMPIAILDVNEFINRAISGDEHGELHPEGVSAGITEAETAAKKLAGQGFLVLQRQAILAAPEIYLMKMEPVAKP